MSEALSAPNRRGFLVTSAAAILVTATAAACGPTRPGPTGGAVTGATGAGATGGGDAIRPFHINVAQADLDELRRRVLATRWPSRETVADQSQGVQLAKLQELVRYWGTSYDWRKVEARLNALPQFMTEIDGLDIHFLHVRSKHPDALPMIITHGWPGSVLELLKVIAPSPTRPHTAAPRPTPSTW